MFAKRLKELMRVRNITWKEVSETCHIGRGQLYYWENNDTIPYMETVQKLAEYFGVSTDYLLGIDDKIESVKAIVGITTENKGVELSPQEEALIGFFRKASEQNKLRIIHAVVEFGV